MTKEQELFIRIDKLTFEQKPLFGLMNVNQMVCHCTDQLRLAMGAMKAKDYNQFTSKEIIAISKSGKTVPAPKGFGQVEGEGTKPTNLKNDIRILKEHISNFTKLENDFDFKPHPYFGKFNKKQWTKLTICHLNHHLKQFNV